MDFTSYLDQGAQLFDNIAGISDYNNAQSVAMADRQNEWQVAQNAKAMAFNQNEAAKARNWQEYMSNTAHQREVRDLRLAGLNPILSAMGGNGAAVTTAPAAQGVTSSGAKGQVDTSTNAALVGLLSSMLQTTQSLEAANINARTQEAYADRIASAAELGHWLSYTASKYSADRHLAGTVYSADQHLEGTKYSADKASESSKYSADTSFDQNMMSALMSLLGTEYSSDVNFQARMAEVQQKYDEANGRFKVGPLDLSGLFSAMLGLGHEPDSRHSVAKSSDNIRFKGKTFRYYR